MFFGRIEALQHGARHGYIAAELFLASWPVFDKSNEQTVPPCSAGHGQVQRCAIQRNDYPSSNSENRTMLSYLWWHGYIMQIEMQSSAKCSFSQAVSETEKAVSTVKAAGASLQIARLDAALLQKQAGS